MGKFILKKTKNDGFMFNLLATNGQVICTSQTYASKASAKNGIESVRKNVGAEIEDQTIAEPESKKNPKWELYKDKGGDFRFRLCASNGEPILSGQGYTTKENAKNGIDSIRRNAPESEIVEELD